MVSVVSLRCGGCVGDISIDLFLYHGNSSVFNLNLTLIIISDDLKLLIINWRYSN